MSERGFLHDVRVSDGYASVIRVREEDGHILDEGEYLVAKAPLRTIKNFPSPEPVEPSGFQSGYFETDPDVPTYLVVWAEYQILTAYNTPEYEAAEAAWLTPEPEPETQDIVANDVRPGDTIVGMYFNGTGWMGMHHEVASIRRHTSSRGFLSGVPMINFRTEGGHTVRSDRSRIIRVIRPKRTA